MRRARRAAAATVVVLCAACGGGGSASATPTPSLNGEQTKSPSEILGDAHAALAGVDSISIDASFTDPHGTTTFRADVDLAGRRAHLVGAEGGGHFETIIAGGKVYLLGDAAFYTATNQQSLGEIVAGQWVIPPQSSGLVTGLLALVDRSNMADCVLGQTHGTLTMGSESSVGGTVVVDVLDAGDVAGSAPETISVSLVGTAYPLQVRQTGPAKSGGTAAPSCSLASASTTSGTASLHNVGVSVAVTPPANPIDLTLLGGGGPAPASPTP